ncbi:hypothetical protein BDV32DRAFT_118955 [Aspergillus pseudonomiae]|nr:hypothetical protein BDV32DRAFT_118955 [Aspergillus pseudonomiae]
MASGLCDSPVRRSKRRVALFALFHPTSGWYPPAYSLAMGFRPCCRSTHSSGASTCTSGGSWLLRYILCASL